MSNSLLKYGAEAILKILSLRRFTQWALVISVWTYRSKKIDFRDEGIMFLGQDFAMVSGQLYRGLALHCK